MKTLTYNQQRVIEATHQVLELANKLYNTTVRLHQIKWHSGVRTYGYASSYQRRYELSYNTQYTEAHADEMIKEIVPHEVAHLIHFYLKEQGRAPSGERPHGKTWQTIARKLGASGNRLYAIDNCAVVSTRKIKLFTYANEDGISITMKANMHKKLQMGLYDSVRNRNGDKFYKHNYVGMVI